jgi:peptide/nickel transport system permease protein
MARFLLRRFANSVALVLLATVMIFFLASMTLNPRANYEGRNPPVPAASVNQKLDQLNMNPSTPIPVRFRRWLADLAHGDFGQTIDGRSVNEEMGRRMGVSLRLLLLGSLVGAFFGVMFGVLGALRQYRPSDRLVTVLSFVLLSTPVFFLAVLLKVGALQVNGTVGTTLLYYTGEKTPGLDVGTMGALLDRLQHLILPTLSIALGSIAFYSRYQRNAMLDVLGSDFLRTAQAKGLTRRRALFKHGVRTALIPMSTFFAFSFGTLLVGATFTEKIFGWHGMGEWFVDSINKNDINAVSAVTLFSAVCILVSGFLADLAYAALDPRVRFT